MGLGNRLQKASPTILTLLGVGGVVATAVLTARAVPKAEQRRKDAEEESKSELTVVEIVKAEAPAYAPAAMVGIGTIVCIFGANMLNRRQQASLASAYALMERTFHQYKDKVKAIFGEEGNHIVECAMEEENREIEEEQPPWDEVQTFYFEPYGKFFERTMEQVFQAEYHLNRNFRLAGKVTVNDFLDFLGLEHVSTGDEFGWNDYDGEVFYGYQWIDFSHRYILTDDGLTVCCIDTPFPPHMGETLYSNGWEQNLLMEGYTFYDEQTRKKPNLFPDQNAK